MKTAMQELIVHLEMLKSRVDMVDVGSLIEYATTSLEKEKEQIKLSWLDGKYFGNQSNEEDYYNQTYNQNK
jgi:hypothetical protein